MYTFVSHSPKEGFMPGRITAVVSCHVDYTTVWPVPSLLSAALICITICWVLYTCGLGSDQNRWIKALGSLWEHKVWREGPNVWCCVMLHDAAWCTPVASSSRCCFLEMRSWEAISSSNWLSSCFLHTALQKQRQYWIPFIYLIQYVTLGLENTMKWRENA